MKKPATTEKPFDAYEYYWDYDYYDYDGPFTIDFGLFAEVTLVLSKFDTVITFVAFFLNLFHLFILTRREMRTQFMFILMIGICVSDLFLFSASTIKEYSYDFIESDPCGTTRTPTGQYIKWIGLATEDVTRRTSTWIAMFMALSRVLISMFPFSRMSQKMQRPIFALLLITLAFIPSVLWDGSFWMRFELAKVNDELDCFGVFINRSIPRYDFYYTEKYGKIQEFCQTANGFIKVFTGFLYLILTIALVVLLIKHRRSRRRMNQKNQRSSSTIGLVTFMALLYFVSESFDGTVRIIRFYFWQRNRDVQYVALHSSFLTQTVFVVNSTIHCLFSPVLSTLYRDTIKRLFCCRINKKSAILKATSVTEHTSKNKSR